MQEQHSSTDIMESIDRLAMMTKAGFDELRGDLNEFKTEMYEFKDEMYQFRDQTNTSLFNVDGTLKDINKRLTAVEKSIEPLVRDYSIIKSEIADLNSRVPA